MKSAHTYYPNMDLMRYVMSIAVIIAHINGAIGSDIPFFLTSYEAVGGFFAISGFLMYPNYIRHNNFKLYTLHRARRILPPYIFIVVAAALCLVAVSCLTWREYFLSSGFWKYLAANLSFLNWLHPDLPGVFQGVRYATSAVNPSLWTMKVEWCLYLSVPIFVFLQAHLSKLRKETLVLELIALSVLYRLIFTYFYFSTGSQIYDILRRQIFGQFSFFYAGMLIFFLRSKIERHPLFTIAIGFFLWVVMKCSPYWFSIFLEPFAISAVVLGISLLPYDITPLRHKNNISYHLYLFHYPVIQLGIYFGIAVCGPTAMTLYVFAVTTLLSLFAHFSLKKIIQ